MDLQPAGFPVGIQGASVSLCSEPTDLIVSTYNDAAVLMASQLGTVGTVVIAK